MKNKNVLIYGGVLIITILILVISFSFAFLGATKNLVNNLPVNVTFADGVAANFIVTGNTNISLNIPGNEMLMDTVGEVVAQNSIGINVSLQSSFNLTCSYAITWKWLEDSDVYERSFSADNEFVVAGTDGTQNLGEINVPYEDSLVLGRYIISTNNATTTQNWTFTSKFYNLDVNQDHHENKTYEGQIAIENAHCYETSKPALVNYIIYNAASSGVDSQGNNWYFYSTTHSSDSKTDYRYAGKNPNNFIEFNGEMWRIIGIMPVEYDTNSDGVADTQGNLIKIIRNTSFNTGASLDYKQVGVGSSTYSSGSNAWSDSQTMLMFNPSIFYTTGYTVGRTVPILSTIRNSYSVDENGIKFYRNPGSLWDTSLYSIYRPAAATTTGGFTSSNTFTKCSDTTVENCFKQLDGDSQGMVATVKWNLGGISTVAANAETIYANERGNSVCATISGSTCTPGTNSLIRPTYWYGKVGLPYASDFGFAAGGSNDGTTYPRANCLTANLNASGNYRTYCGVPNYLIFKNATASANGTALGGTLLTAFSTNTYSVTYMTTSGYVYSTSPSSTSYYTRPTLYLDPRAVYISGDGSYNNPYRFL